MASSLQLRPRHYLLLAVILALGVYNIVRIHRARQAAVPAVHRGIAPAWTSYDNAYTLRDAPAEQFDPALQQLQQAIDTTTSSEATDLHGCLTWLLFYRQNILHPNSAKPEFREQTAGHVAACQANHQDAAR